MTESDVKCKKPPVLKHLGRNTYMRNIVAAVLFAGVSAFAFRVLYVYRRRKLYRDFYENYDPDEAFERMASKGGLFQSCLN